MCPKQQETWCQYNDVILNDNTSKTNCYDMFLSFFVAIDNNMKSQIIAQALMDRKTKFSAMYNKCNRTNAKSIVTDADPGMDAI
jgi:hypothetical protein